jgi:hypothetical protein
MLKWLEAADGVTAGPGPDSQRKLAALKAQLDRFRCTCGEFPKPNGRGILACCNHLWDDWECVLFWKEAQNV